MLSNLKLVKAQVKKKNLWDSVVHWLIIVGRYFDIYTAMIKNDNKNYNNSSAIQKKMIMHRQAQYCLY